MAEYYLVSQLPSLDGLHDASPIPITEERFCRLCRENLGKRAMEEFDKITLLPSKNAEKSSSALIEAWNEGERNLRLALCRVRAEKQGFGDNTKGEPLSTAMLEVAKTASQMESPMEAEEYLGEYRMSFLESLRPMDTFCEDYVFYYGLKLKLILRMRKFDRAAGQAAYKEIYSSILNGEELEAEQ